MFLPIFLRTEANPTLVIGGGEVATRKIQMLCDLGCPVTVIAPQIDAELHALIAAGRVVWHSRLYQAGDCKDFQLVVAATDQRDTNRAVFEDAKVHRVAVNVVDDPELCTAIFPATLRDGPLIVAVSTSAVAPFMASAVRDWIAGLLGKMGRWIEAAGAFRHVVRARTDHPAEQARLYRQFRDAVQPEAEPHPPDTERIEDWTSWLAAQMQKK